MTSNYSWSSKVILVVEDDAYSVLLLKSVLSSTGAKLLFAEDGETAITLVKEKNGGIDVVLMDIRLKGISGLEATQRIKKLTPATPVIAQTACAMVGDQERCIGAGCDAYLTKPLEVNSLLKTINNFFSKPSSNGVLESSFYSN